MNETDAKLNTKWADAEFDAAVAAYFRMLGYELAGTSYIKSQHTAASMTGINRSHRSIELRNGNISAVLDNLGLPWILGYKPLWHYSKALVDAVDRYLSKHKEALKPPIKAVAPLELLDVFVESPSLSADAHDPPQSLLRLISKFDPVKRDARNRALGRAGEGFVVEVETQKLIGAGRSDLAREVRWISEADGDGAGYDVLSFHPSGARRLIEVKTTNGSARTPFFLSRNEIATAQGAPEAWRLYRVHQFASRPRIFEIAPPIEASVRLRAETWRASF
jgi:hypothetical protein